MENIKSEFLDKVSKIRNFIKNSDIGGVEVGLQTNFSWLTGGRGFVGLASEDSCASVLITADQVYFLVNNIEKPRLLDEEISCLADALEVRSYMWYDGVKKASIVEEVLNGKKALTDAQMQREFQSLRSRLTDSETERYRILGKSTADAVEYICVGLKPGVREFEIAGEVSSALWSRGIEPITVLVAFDERLCSYRHPLPTDKKLAKYAMIAVCARMHGLVISLSRLASLGRISKDVGKKHKAVAEIDACFIINTRPGAKTGDIFRKAVLTYKKTGFGDEWELHHQGGLTGYSAREYVATMDSTDIVEAGQAFAWNPSITGTKSEDTIIVAPDENRIITHTGNYAYLEAEYGNEKVLRPDILAL